MPKVLEGSPRGVGVSSWARYSCVIWRKSFTENMRFSPALATSEKIEGVGDKSHLLSPSCPPHASCMPGRSVSLPPVSGPEYSTTIDAPPWWCLMFEV